MKNTLIHVVIPQSFVDERHVNPFDLADSMSVIYNDKSISFQVDLVPDDYFDDEIRLIP